MSAYGTIALSPARTDPDREGPASVSDNTTIYNNSNIIILYNTAALSRRTFPLLALPVIIGGIIIAAAIRSHQLDYSARSLSVRPTNTLSDIVTRQEEKEKFKGRGKISNLRWLVPGSTKPATSSRFRPAARAMNTDDPWTNDRLPREITVDPQSYGTTADRVLRILESLKPALSKSTRHGSFSVDNRCTQRDKPERAVASQLPNWNSRRASASRHVPGFHHADRNDEIESSLGIGGRSEIHSLIRRRYLASLCAPFTNKRYHLSHKRIRSKDIVESMNQINCIGIR